MEKKSKKNLFYAICMLALFGLWTVLVCFIDIKEIGPQNSSVGLATINLYIHKLTGVHMSLYLITDWLSLIPIGFVLGFALAGLIQWIKRKHIKNIDFGIFVLGGFYIVVFAVYILFEIIVINYRPVLIEGVLEASYPSSTTMLVMCIVPTAIMQFNTRINNKALKHIISFLLGLFAAFMVIARLFSGVHWFTDIIGGALLSAGLVMMYIFVCSLKIFKK